MYVGEGASSVPRVWVIPIKLVVSFGLGFDAVFVYLGIECFNVDGSSHIRDSCGFSVWDLPYCSVGDGHWNGVNVNRCPYKLIRFRFFTWKVIDYPHEFIFLVGISCIWIDVGFGLPGVAFPVHGRLIFVLRHLRAEYQVAFTRLTPHMHGFGFSVFGPGVIVGFVVFEGFHQDFFDVIPPNKVVDLL